MTRDPVTCFSLPGDVKLWEALSALQIIQAISRTELVSVHCFGDALDLCQAGGIGGSYQDNLCRLAFAEAHRKIDDAGKRPYVDLLEELSGLSKLKLSAPQFPLLHPGNKGSIVVAPFPVRPDMGIPLSIWKHLVLHLRTYDRPVYQIGERGERQEECAYSEGDILCDLPVADRLEAVADAELIVGVPNIWTWAATAWNKKQVIMYPDSVPLERWFPYGSRAYGIMLYEKTKLQVPVILTALRQIIRSL